MQITDNVLKKSDLQTKDEYKQPKALNSGACDVVQYASFGYTEFGPFLYAYVSWLNHEIMSAGIHKVYFFARDGYLMEKAFRVFLEQKHSDVDAKYVYFSRRSIRQAMLWRSTSYADSLKYMSVGRFISAGEILEYYGFSSDECFDISKQYGLILSEEYSVNGLEKNKKIHSIYLGIQEKIRLKSQQQDQLLQQYIKQIGMKDRCAIVDIGWHGRMQQYVELYFNNCNIPLECSGYYIGIKPVVALKGSAKGFLYDDEHPKLRKSVLCFFGGYEKLFQSCEGSTYGYREINGTVEPVLGTYEYQERTDIQSNIHAWQNGALRFVEEAIRRGTQVDDAMTRRLINVGKYPSCRHVAMFSFFYSDDGKTHYFISQKALWRYRPKELVHALSNSQWKTGFMKSLFKLPLPYYLIFWLIRK